MGKKSIIALCISVCFLFLSPLLHAGPLKIGVISDLHYMDPSLLIEAGSAFDNYMRSDRKLLKESPAILKATVENLIKEQVDVVLITGDLTKDGELISHEGVAKTLRPLLDKGIKVLVIPGNHDINNPHALSFFGKTTKVVPTVSASEFRKIYEDYGFGTAISADTSSLSYVSEPMEGLRVLCIDDCEYYNNKFKSKGDLYNSCVSNGTIKPETMEWARNEIVQARLQGKQIIGMIHHNVVEHFDYERLLEGSMTDNYADVQKQLMAAGLRMILTGHFHATDIARVDGENGNCLYDVETGSIVTYPCPYRLIEFAGDSMKIETKRIEQIDAVLPGGMDFQTYAKSQLVKVLPSIISGMVSARYKSISNSVPKFAASFVEIPKKEDLIKMISKHLLSSGTDLILAHYCGNENLTDSAGFKRDKMLRDMDGFVKDFSEESSGLFAPIAQSTIEKSNAMKCVRVTVRSIWDDRTEQEYPIEDYGYQSQGPVDDLNLVIQLPRSQETSAK